jgi:hypothetical protein
MRQEVQQPMRFSMPLLFALAATLVAALVPAGAQAGNSYLLEFCHAAANHSVEGFAAVQDRGLITRRDCAETGAVREGLMVRTARDTIKGHRRFEVPYRGVAGLSFQAPPGTVIKRVLWGGAAARRSCDWLAQLRIADENQPTARNELLAGHKRDQKRCDDRRRPGPLRIARPKKIRGYTVLGNPKYDVPRPKTLYQRVLCINRRGCPLGSDPQAYILTENLRLEIVDEQAPTQLAAIGGDLFGGWINNNRTLNYTASDDGSGVKTVRAVNDSGAEIASITNNCLFTRPVPCPNGAGSLIIRVDRARQGTQNVALQAFDAADNPTGLVHAGTMQVDTIAPGAAAVSVDGGSAWRNSASHTLRWSNSDNAGDVAPISGVRYRVCPKDTRCEVSPASGASTDQLTLDATPGETDVTLWRVDAAGNENTANASVPVTLRYDPEAPHASFDPLDGSDPTRLTAPVSDKYSGVAAGQIELSPQGSGAWQTLPTQQEGSKLVARVDDYRLPAGTYQARVVVRDHAGNTTVSEQTSAGQPMLLQLPLRIESRLSGGVAHERTVRRRVGRKGKRRVVRRKVTVYRASTRTRLGRKISLGGVLTNRDGNPIAGAQIHVYSTPQGGAEQLAGVVQTDAKGRYTYTLRADANRTLRLAYQGTTLILPAERQVEIRVAAASSFRVSKRRVPNGGRVLFSGRVRSLPVPATGKIVELQWRVGGADWGTFRTVRTDANGRWRLRYRFSRIRSTVKLAFRARVPAEGGYPFVSGGSRVKRITVTGRG